MTNERNELAQFILERHLRQRRRPIRMYDEWEPDIYEEAPIRWADEDPEPTHDEWQLATLDDLDEQTMLEEAA